MDCLCSRVLGVSIPSYDAQFWQSNFLCCGCVCSGILLFLGQVENHIYLGRYVFNSYQKLHFTHVNFIS